MAWGFVGKAASKAAQSLRKAKNTFKKNPADEAFENDLRRAEAFASEQSFRNNKGLKEKAANILKTPITPKNAFGFASKSFLPISAGLTTWQALENAVNRNEQSFDFRPRPNEASMIAGVSNVGYGLWDGLKQLHPDYIGEKIDWKDKINRGVDEMVQSAVETAYQGNPLTLGIGLNTFGFESPSDKMQSAQKIINNASQKTTEKAPAAATTEQQQNAQSPAESWPQERARLAKEMQDSIKANPNDPSKWKVPQGWGAVRGSDGEMRYHIPDERFDPVKAQREEDVARAKVYYNSALSNASSPLSTPAYRASQQDLMDQLVRDFPEIAQNQVGGGLIVANGRAGLRGGSNAIDPAVKLALEQQEQMRKLEAENIEKMVEDAKRMDPDNPVGQAEDIARALLAPQTFGRVNPYEPVMQAWQRANALNHNVINKTLRDNGIYDFESTNVRKDLPTLKNLTNSMTNTLFGTEFFDDEYMVGDNVIDASKLAPVSKRSMDNTDAYNTYLRQAEAQGIRPMDYTTWLLTGGYRG